MNKTDEKAIRLQNGKTKTLLKYLYSLEKKSTKILCISNLITMVMGWTYRCHSTNKDLIAMLKNATGNLFLSFSFSIFSSPFLLRQCYLFSFTCHFSFVVLSLFILRIFPILYIFWCLKQTELSMQKQTEELQERKINQEANQWRERKKKIGAILLNMPFMFTNDDGIMILMMKVMITILYSNSFVHFLYYLNKNTTIKIKSRKKEHKTMHI